MPGPSARGEDAGAHTVLSTQRTSLRQSPGHGAGNTPTPGWPVVTAVLSLLKAPEGNLRERLSGSRPLSLPELPAGSQGQGVPKDRASPPLRTGAEERVAKGPL